MDCVLVKGRVLYLFMYDIHDDCFMCTVNLSMYNVLYMFQVNLIAAGRVLMCHCKRIPSLTVLIFWFWLWLLGSTGGHCD
jgi:hypothetical protein